MKLVEILNKPLPFKVEEHTKSFYQAEFTAGDRVIRFSATNEAIEYGDSDDEDSAWMIEFGEVAEYGQVDHEKTGSGAEFQVFATLRVIIDDFIKKCNPKIIEFSADKDKKNNRARVYAKLFKKNMPPGWKFKEEDNKNPLVPIYFMMVKEALDKPLPYELTRDTERFFEAKFTAGDRDIFFEAVMMNKDSDSWEVSFMEKSAGKKSSGFKKSGSGNEFAVFATVKKLIEDFIAKRNPTSIIFDSTKSEANRANLYQRMLSKNLPTGWKMERDDEHPSYTSFVLSKA